MHGEQDNPVWCDAWQRLRAVDGIWANVLERQAKLTAVAAWLTAQAPPRLAALARLIQPEMTRSQFWSVLVPVERAVARFKVTDVEMLDADLPADAAPDAVRMPLTVVADSIRSAFNLGGVLRTAECFGVAEVVLCGYTPLPTQRRVARAALGAERLVLWRQAPDLHAALTHFKSEGRYCVVLETVACAVDITVFDWPFPVALVIGNERFGVNPDVVDRCDAVVRIPLFGRKNSLNVVSALAIALHAARQRFEAGNHGRDLRDSVSGEW